MTGPWIKLWRSFLSDPTIQYLKKRHGDVTVTVTIALLTATRDGVVVTPEDELAVMCDLTDEKWIELVQIIIQKGMFARNDDGIIYVPNWIKYQQCDSTQRTKAYRERKASEEIGIVTVTSQSCHGDENVTGRSKKLEDRSKKEERERPRAARVQADSESESKPSLEKQTFGEFGNVRLSPLEHSSLLSNFGSDWTRSIIEKLSGYKAAKGKNYKSDMAAIRQWVIESVGATPQPKAEPPCPHCGKPLDQGACMNGACPQYAEETV